MNTYNNLNENEILVLKAIVIASDESTGGDFTYFDEVMEKINTLTQQQVKGYVSQLSQKNYIYVSDDKFCQICAGQYVDYLTDYEF
jgi:hypothetical protein